jgi:hypothetical protein
MAMLSCAHVIPKENLLTQVVTLGPSRKQMEFKYENRNDDSLVGSCVETQHGSKAFNSHSLLSFTLSTMLPGSGTRTRCTRIKRHQLDTRRCRRLFTIICVLGKSQGYLAEERSPGEARCEKKGGDMHKAGTRNYYRKIGLTKPFEHSCFMSHSPARTSTMYCETMPVPSTA